MTRQTDELDRLIDQLNAGDETPPHEPDDPELADLMDAVQRVRQLRDAATPETDWPARAVSELARDLHADQSPAEHEPEAPEPNNAHDVTPLELSASTSTRPPKRRTITRELAQMAAAIAVLVVVGGVLALVFHNQSGSNQGGIAAGGTPSAVAGAQLPMTVTANGVALQLQSVDSSSTATRFNFMIRLAPGQLGSHGFCCALGPDPSTYLTIEGITPEPGDPYGSESDGGSDPPIIRFSLQYQSPFPTDHAVTITIKRLGLPPSPGTPTGDQASNVKQAEGPWTFRITPGMVANQPEPTPSEPIGRFGGVSVPFAQKWTSFPIVAPTPLPAALSQGEQLKRNEFNVIGFGLGVPETAPANYVMFTYSPAISPPFYLVETTNKAAVPQISGDTASVLMPDPTATAGRNVTLTIAPGSLSTSHIGGTALTRFESSDTRSSSTTTYYVWQIGDVYYSIRNTVGPSSGTMPPNLKPITDDDLRQMAVSIIKQRTGSNATTTTSKVQDSTLPTRAADGGYYNLTFDEAQQLTPMTLITPTYIPPSLDENRLTIMIPPVPPVGSPKGPPTGANISYPAKDNKGSNVEIEETSLPMNPVDAGGSAAATTTNGSVSNIEIENTVVIRRATTGQDGQTLSTYFWKQGSTTMILTGTVNEPSSEQEIEHMIASMIEQGT